MTREERAMLRFALSWLPYGGGDELVLPEFGIFPPVFYRRLLRLLETCHDPEVDPAAKAELVELCSLKLTRCRGARKSTRRTQSA